MAGKRRETDRNHWGNANPLSIMGSLWAYRAICYQLVRRRVLQKTRGSYLGIAWSLLTPLSMLLVYTFVFSVVFKTRWHQGFGETPLEYGVVLFCGLIAFNVFSESVLVSPGVIRSHREYVKKVAFPLELLPVVPVGASLADALFQTLVLLAAIFFTSDGLSLYTLLLPVLFIPLILFSLGVSWFVASVGVFVRDVTHLLEIGVTMLFFLTPILYPISAVPEKYRIFLFLNPLCFLVSYFRDVALWSQLPDPLEFAGVFFVTLLVFSGGFWWFSKTKENFADIV